MSSPTPFEVLHISLGGSQDDKTAKLARGIEVLRHVRNGDHSHPGELRKRRGFTRIPLTSTTHGETPESVFVSLGVTGGGELVLLGFRDVYGVAANDAAVNDAALVRRGPSMLGSYRVGTVHAAPIGGA